MCGRGGGRRRRRGYGATGFEEAGGYMAAKIAKLQNQYNDSVDREDGETKSGLFSGVAIFVNGYTEPTAEELKRLMMVHGGVYHHYYSTTKTTHIIATNLPDTKVKNMNTGRIVSPKWITDSLAAGHLLNYTKYVLYNNQSRSQPQLQFKPVQLPVESPKALSNSKAQCSMEDKQTHETCQEISNISPVDDIFAAHQSNTAKSYSWKDSEDAEGKSELKTYEVNASTSSHTSTLNKSPTTSDFHNKSPVKGHAMSTANPKFLSEFYNNSRLHHISTMGAMFKEYVNELQNKCDGFPGREKLKEWIAERNMSTEMDSEDFSHLQMKNKQVIMHIDMDCFFVSVGLRKHPELRGKPVAVTHARGNAQGPVREGMDRQFELNYKKQRAEEKVNFKIQTTGSTKQTKEQELKNNDEAIQESNERLDAKFAVINLIDETSSLSEIASCNYEARKAGVKNGTFLGAALKLCPELKTIPYDFEGYKEVSYKLYDTVASFTHDIEAVSCDEMFVDLGELLRNCKVSPQDFTTFLREKVQAETGCPCSAGLGPNMLVARMATRLAKPNGQHWADPEDMLLYMKDHKVTELPGVGWSTGKRLEAEGLKTCGDLQQCSLAHLRTLLGPRTGHSLYNYCRGIDTRAVKSEHVRKSVSAEVNYGIRFTSQSDAHKFIGELAAEVEARLSSIKMKGRCITLKLKIRAKDAPVETAKFMGHGVCDNVAKSVSLASSTASADIIERETLGLLSQIKTPPQDFRGVGIQMSRLESASASKTPNTSIKSFLLGARKKVAEIGKTSAGSLTTAASLGGGETSLARNRSPEVLVRDSQEDKQSHREFDTGHSYEENQPGNAGQSTNQSHPSSEAQAAAPSSNTSSIESKSIDVEVLLALPEDMREQVIAEYQQQGYIIPALPCSRGGGESSSGTSRPQPSTSGYQAPEQRITNPLRPTAADGTELNKNTGGSNSETNDERSKRNTTDVTDFRFVAETSNSNSNFSTGAENFQDSALITSFSQVDSSFLEAIPEELREELRQDIERMKQTREGAAAARPGSLVLRGSPVKTRSRGRGNHRGGGRRGRRSKAESRRVESEGMVTLDTMMFGGAKQQGHWLTRNIRGGQKRTMSQNSSVPEPDTVSPSKKITPSEQREEMRGGDGSPQLFADITNDAQSANEPMMEVKVESDIVPDLCGIKELSEVKSLIQAWVASCPHPENEDAHILAAYFTSLITSHDLEKLDCLIKYLYRQILRTSNKLWEAAYQVVMDQVQLTMLETHGIKLKVTLFEDV